VLAAEDLAEVQRRVDHHLPPGWQAELLGGRVVVNPPAGYRHNRFADRVQRFFLERMPDGLDATVLGEGVYRRDGFGEYMVPDVVVFRPDRVENDRLHGDAVELVGEIVSPANRREADYESEVVERAVRFGVPWVLIVDPDARTVRWWHDGRARNHGPPWTADLTWQHLA
jgi:Uma2 family endonuclease